MTTENNYFTYEPVIYISIVLGGCFLLLNVFMSCIHTDVQVYYKIIICAILTFIILFIFIYFAIYFIIIGGKNYKEVLLIIFLFAIIPTVATVFFLFLLPTQTIGIFENTIGYLFCKFFYKKLMDDIFQGNNEDFYNRYKDNFVQDKSVLLTLFKYEKEEKFKNMYENFNKNDYYNFYITPPFKEPEQSQLEDLLTRQTGGGNITKTLKNGIETFKQKETLIQELHKIVYDKNTIGILSWFFISSLFASIISLKILAKR